MSKFWIDDGSWDGRGNWPPVEAANPREAVGVWLATNPDALKWLGGMSILVRSEDGTVTGLCSVNWRDAKTDGNLTPDFIEWKVREEAKQKAIDLGAVGDRYAIACGRGSEDRDRAESHQATAEERIPHLMRTPAMVRWLSCEPLLEAVDLTRWLGGMPRHEEHAANCDGSCFDASVLCAEIERLRAVVREYAEAKDAAERLSEDARLALLQLLGRPSNEDRADAAAKLEACTAGVARLRSADVALREIAGGGR